MTGVVNIARVVRFLTGPQREALAKLVVGPRETSRRSSHDHISGTTAKSLERQGLATWRGHSPAIVTITELGLRVAEVL